MSIIAVGMNAYMDITEADTLIEEHFFSDDDEYKVWNSLSINDKEKIIVKGTKLIDSIPFKGVKFNRHVDRLEWPRIIKFEKLECPKDVKIALLRQMLKSYSDKNKQETKLQSLGVKSYSIKNASITFKDNDTALDNGIYIDVLNSIRKWIY